MMHAGYYSILPSFGKMRNPVGKTCSCTTLRGCSYEPRTPSGFRLLPSQNTFLQFYSFQDLDLHTRTYTCHRLCLDLLHMRTINYHLVICHVTRPNRARYLPCVSSSSFPVSGISPSQLPTHSSPSSTDTHASANAKAMLQDGDQVLAFKRFRFEPCASHSVIWHCGVGC